MDQKPEDQKQDPAQTPPSTDQASAASGTETPPASNPETPSPVTSDKPTPTPATDATSTDASTTPTPAPTDAATPATPPAPSTAPTTPLAPPAKGKPKAMIVIIVMVLVFIAAAGGYLYMTMQNQQKPMAPKAPPAVVNPTAVPVTAPPTPAISPVTTGNVDSTLNNSDAKVKEATDQAQTDLNSVKKVNSSQDSTSGL